MLKKIVDKLFGVVVVLVSLIAIVIAITELTGNQISEEIMNKGKYLIYFMAVVVILRLVLKVSNFNNMNKKEY